MAQQDIFYQPNVMVRESFLHFIWRFQKFDNVQLFTSQGMAVQIYALGSYNTDAGPDFLNAKLLLGDITWYGHVEIHLKSSDWNRHKHHLDQAYNNVILHVVWEHDEEVYTEKGQRLPVVELKERIRPDLLKKCNQLIKSPENIACSAQLDKVSDMDKLSMLDQSGVQRLKQKSEFVLQLLDANKGNWEETTYQVLVKNFGFKTNEDSFLKLSQCLSHKRLISHAHQEVSIEALIFGMAGFLRQADDDFAKTLQSEFDYLSKKYKLSGLEMLRAEWKFLRLRPGNFPTVRLAQLAAFIKKNAKSFDQIIHYRDMRELHDFFKIQLSPYWQSHYDFGKEGGRKNHGMGKASVELLMINSVAPILAAYAQYTDHYDFMDKAVALLQSIKPEKNHITKIWEDLELKAKDAFNSQSMIGLYNEFCLKKKCLSCKIGMKLINS